MGGFRWVWTATEEGNWHPVTWLSHMLDVQVFGLHAGGHHFVSLLFHVANTSLLFLALREWTGAIWRSAFVAALFALHPLHVESVAWAAERKDVLSTFFGILALRAWTRHVRRPSRGGMISVAVLLALGLMSKPMLVTFPFVLLIMDFWPLGRWRGHLFPPTTLWLEKTSLFALAAVSGIVTYVVQSRAGAVAPIEHFAFVLRAANALVAYASYLAKTIMPTGLAVFYPHLSTLPAASKLIGAAAVVTAFSLLAIVGRRRHPALLVGWLWYLGTLIPVIGLVQVGAQSMADRYTYLPLVGFFIMMAWSLPGTATRRRTVRIALPAGVILFISTLAVISHRQAGYWRDGRRLFDHALAVTQRNFVAHLSLGNILLQSGDLAGASEHYREALALRPDLEDVHNQLGNVAFRQGRLPEAKLHYLEALAIRPGFATAQHNLGLVYLNEGKFDDAIARFREALLLRPDFADPLVLMGVAFEKLGRNEEAARNYRTAIGMRADYTDAYLKLAALQARMGDRGGARESYRAVLAFDPGSVAARTKLEALRED